MAFIFRFRERTTAGVTCLRSYYTFHLQLWSYTVTTLNFYYKPVKSLKTVLARIFQKMSNFRNFEFKTIPVADSFDIIIFETNRLNC